MIPTLWIRKQLPAVAHRNACQEPAVQHGWSRASPHSSVQAYRSSSVAGAATLAAAGTSTCTTQIA
jgi:hypothetical protein